MAQTNKRVPPTLALRRQMKGVCMGGCFRQTGDLHPRAAKVGNSPIPAIVGRIPRGVQCRITIN